MHLANPKKPSYPVLRCFSRIGAWLGHTPSMVLLGAVYESGAVPGLEIDAANELYEKAAEKGNIQAMWRLGVNHTGGKGGKVDNQKAVYWLKKAADGGHDMAAWALGKMHLVGRLVDKDVVKGIQYLQQAAVAGSNEARMNLVQIYREGQYGVSADPDESARWAALGAAAGTPDD